MVAVEFELGEGVLVKRSFFVCFGVVVFAGGGGLGYVP